MSFNHALGFRVAGDGSSVLLEATERHEVAPGTIHFAVLSTLAEVAAAQAVAASVVPTHVSVQLVKRAQTGKLEARGRVLRAGRALVFAEGEVYQLGVLVAKATVTFARV